MTAEQKEIITGFRYVTFLPGYWNKRFINTLISASSDDLYELTDKQNEWLYRLLYAFRRQLPGLYSKHQNNPLCTKLK